MMKERELERAIKRELGDKADMIDRKEIKNLHIGVYPLNSRVRVATPIRDRKIDNEAVR